MAERTVKFHYPPHPLERPLPRLHIPDQYSDHTASSSLPLHDGFLGSLRTDPHRDTPNNFIKLVRLHMADITNLQTSYMEDTDASAPFRQQLGWIDDARRFFDAEKDKEPETRKNVFYVRAEGEHIPYAIKEANLEDLAQSINPFAQRKKGLEEVIAAAERFFGFSNEPFDGNEHSEDIATILNYARSQEIRWKGIGRTFPSGTPGRDNAIENNNVFYEFYQLTQKTEFVLKNTDHIEPEMLEHAAPFLTDRSYHHTDDRYQSPKLEAKIEDHYAVSRQFESGLSKDGIRRFITIEMVDIADELHALKRDPFEQDYALEIKIDKVNQDLAHEVGRDATVDEFDFAPELSAEGKIKELQNQRQILSDTLFVLDSIFMDPDENHRQLSDEVKKKYFELYLMPYLVHLQRRFMILSADDDPEMSIQHKIPVTYSSFLRSA